MSQLERPDFYQPEPVDSALYAIGTDGQEQRRIWQGYAYASWSPDGQDTAVWTPRLPDDTWLWITDPTGAVRTPLIKPDAMATLSRQAHVEGKAVGDVGSILRAVRTGA